MWNHLHFTNNIFTVNRAGTEACASPLSTELRDTNNFVFSLPYYAYYFQILVHPAVSFFCQPPFTAISDFPGFIFHLQLPSSVLADKMAHFSYLGLQRLQRVSPDWEMVQEWLLASCSFSGPQCCVRAFALGGLTVLCTYLCVDQCFSAGRRKRRARCVVSVSSCSVNIPYVAVFSGLPTGCKIPLSWPAGSHELLWACSSTALIIPFRQ